MAAVNLRRRDYSGSWLKAANDDGVGATIFCLLLFGSRGLLETRVIYGGFDLQCSRMRLRGLVKIGLSGNGAQIKSILVTHRMYSSMASGNKYAIQITQKESYWTADITRRVSRKETVVSKNQTGFATETEAQAWAEAELKGFMENQSARNLRRDKKRVP